MLPDGATAPASTKHTHRPASPRRAHKDVTAVGRKEIRGYPGRQGGRHIHTGGLRRATLPRNPLVEAVALMPKGRFKASVRLLRPPDGANCSSSRSQPVLANPETAPRTRMPSLGWLHIVAKSNPLNI